MIVIFMISAFDVVAMSVDIEVHHEISQHQKIDSQQDEESVCFVHVHDFTSPFFNQGDEWGLCVTPGVTSTDSAPSLLSSADSQLVSVAAVDVDLVVQVHASLSDAAANASACLPVETSRGQCTFR